MKTKALVFWFGAALVAAGGYYAVQQGYWSPQGAVAQAPGGGKGGGKGGARGGGGGGRTVPVDVAVAIKRLDPVWLDLAGPVTPIASVAVKTRVHTGIA